MDVYGFDFVEKAQREVEQLAVRSLQAFVMSAFPYVSAWLSLRSVKRLLSSAHYVGGKTAISVAPVGKPVVRLSGSSSIRTVEADTTSKCSRVVRMAHALLFVDGVAIFVVILIASGVFSPRASSTATLVIVSTEDCLFPLHPSACVHLMGESTSSSSDYLVSPLSSSTQQRLSHWSQPSGKMPSNGTKYCIACGVRERVPDAPVQLLCIAWAAPPVHGHSTH